MPSTAQFRRDGGHVFALKTGLYEFFGAGLPRTVGPGGSEEGNVVGGVPRRMAIDSLPQIVLGLRQPVVGGA